MSDEKMNRRFEIPVEKIEDTIGMHINGDYSKYKTIVSPRDVVSVEALGNLEIDVLKKMLRKIPLRGYPDIFPYANSGIKVFRRSPTGHEIGQTFIHSLKILGIMQNLENDVFARFDTPGLSKMPATKIYGTDKNKESVIAFYIPPFLEIHGNKVVLIDGIHRSYITKSVGTTMHSIHFTNVGAPLPFEPIEWRDAQIVEEKPPVDERYRNLRKEYFRDLAAVGIDG